MSLTPAHDAVRQHGSQAAAARALNLPRETLRGRLDKEKRIGAVCRVEPAKQNGALHFPELPEKDEPIEQLLNRCEEHYTRQRTYTDAATWQQILVSDRLPIGVALMGDPHLDDPGCNLPELRRHIGLIASTEGAYAINVGDYTNNWVGRLARLYANQELSVSSARRLVEWLLLGSGLRWLAVVLGNHDQWQEGSEIIRRMAAVSKIQIPVHDWAAKVELVFPNSATCRISAAHDFRGRSQTSVTHGLKREMIANQEGANIMVAGHIHYGGVEEAELPGGHKQWLCRVGSYKEMDDHALVNGYHEGKHFKSVFAIVDPDALPHERVIMFSSVRQGTEILTLLREARKAIAAPSRVRPSAKATRPSSVPDKSASQPKKRPRRRQAAAPSRHKSKPPAARRSRQKRSRTARG